MNSPESNVTKTVTEEGARFDRSPNQTIARIAAQALTRLTAQSAWTPHPTRYMPACQKCGSLDILMAENRIDGRLESTVATCASCGRNAPEDLEVCTGCFQTQQFCNCAQEAM